MVEKDKNIYPEDSEPVGEYTDLVVQITKKTANNLYVIAEKWNLDSGELAAYLLQESVNRLVSRTTGNNGIGTEDTGIVE